MNRTACYVRWLRYSAGDSSRSACRYQVGGYPRRWAREDALAAVAGGIIALTKQTWSDLVIAACVFAAALLGYFLFVRPRGDHRLLLL